MFVHCAKIKLYWHHLLISDGGLSEWHTDYAKWHERRHSPLFFSFPHFTCTQSLFTFEQKYAKCARRRHINANYK